MTLPMRGQASRRSSAEEVPSTQLVLPFSLLGSGTKGNRSQTNLEKYLGLQQSNSWSSSSAAAPDNGGEITRTRGLALCVTGVQHCEGKKGKEGQADRAVPWTPV